MSDYNPEELFVLENGRMLVDARQSAIMTQIKEKHPESPSQDSSGYEWSEMGMAELFGEIYENDTKFCTEVKTWYTYDGTRWKKDEANLLVSEKIKEFVRLLTIYGVEIRDEEKRKAWLGFCAKMNDRRFRDRLMKDAASISTCNVSISVFDAHPHLINCLNGTYDLKKMRFRAHDWRDYLTMVTNVSYTTEALTKQQDCERWVQFVDEVTEGDKQKADYLQRALGYSLLGDAPEECMFILYGKTTRNGKSTMLNTIENLLGDYAQVSPVSIICSSGNKDAAAANPVMASLKGRRMVTMSESNQYGKMDEEAVKQMTGGEKISTRQLYGTQFEFKPQFTLFLSCNDLPAVTDRSVFASERLRVIEFNRHFSQQEQDKSLKRQFEEPEAMRGIFKWLLDGYRKYQKRGLAMNEQMQKVVREYEKDNDVVLQFLIDRTEKAEDGRVKLKNLYENYKLWAKSNGYRVMSNKTFAKAMDVHWDCFDTVVYVGGAKVYAGIKMLEG